MPAPMTFWDLTCSVVASTGRGADPETPSEKPVTAIHTVYLTCHHAFSAFMPFRTTHEATG